MLKRKKRDKVKMCNGAVMEEDRLGMSISGDVAEIMKDEKGVIGITIGGGAPNCPCLYVVQVFDGTSAAADGRIRAGDEIFSVNGVVVKGEKKTIVAAMIQKAESPVKIGFNVLHADPKQGRTLDLVVKKMKHRVIESMTSETADALGLSRAILCNDSLVKKLNSLEHSANVYKMLIENLGSMLGSQYRLSRSQKELGDLFCEMAAHEISSNAHHAFSTFGETHRSLEKQGLKLVTSLHPIIKNLNTFVGKAIPDTKLTLKKYLDVKFEYLSFCLKLKEMDDEEIQFAEFNDTLYRVETGNYEYRLMLRCREESREKFLNLRKDVMVKLELLDQKHVQDIAIQLSTFIKAIVITHNECKRIVECANGLYPIDIELNQIAGKYNTSDRLIDEENYIKSIKSQSIIKVVPQPTLNENLLDLS